MKRLAHTGAAMIIGAMLGGCITPAPGAAQVTITRNPADVAACTAVGNIPADDMNPLAPLLAQNQAVGLNANVILNTGAGGIAYRCNKAASAQ